jgi:hypothetical protein
VISYLRGSILKRSPPVWNQNAHTDVSADLIARFGLIRVINMKVFVIPVQPLRLANRPGLNGERYIDDRVSGVGMFLSTVVATSRLCQKVLGQFVDYGPDKPFPSNGVR